MEKKWIFRSGLFVGMLLLVFWVNYPTPEASVSALPEAAKTIGQALPPTPMAAPPLPEPAPVTSLSHSTALLPKPQAVEPPTYTLPQTNQPHLQRAMAKRANQGTYQFKTVSYFAADPDSAQPVQPATSETWVEGRYAHGNLQQKVYHNGSLMVESIMVGDVVYNQMQNEGWQADRLTAVEQTAYRLDPFISLIDEQARIRSLGPDPLVNVASPTTKYEIEISQARAGSYFAQTMMGESVDTDHDQFADLLAAPPKMVVWLGEDDQLYRLDLHLTLAPPAIEDPARSLGQVEMSISTHYSHFNDPTISVDAPVSQG